VEIHVLDPAPTGNWETALSHHPAASIFHSAAWLRVLQRTYGSRLFYLHATRGSAPPLLLPIVEIKSHLTGTRGVSLPFTDLCPPLGSDGGSLNSARDSLLAFGRTRGWSYLEIRGGDPPREDTTPAVSYCAHRADLRLSAAELQSSFAGSARRAWRKAESHGVRVEIGSTMGALRSYCHLHALTRRRHGAPPQPFKFFQHLHEELFARQSGFVVTALLGSLPIAAAVFLHRDKTAVYKFGASDEAHQALRGNSAVMGRALMHLAENGVREVHFGRTSASNEGLRRFKMLWGAVEEPLHYYRLCVHTGRSLLATDRSSGFHTALFRRLPPTLNRWAGRFLYPHLD
jgi:hypothetical protein